jgi:integrative and conjugative element protein (TIGR02256 family)
MRDHSNVIEYAVGTSSQVIVLTKPVLECFRRHRQRRWYQREAGGQLFARFEGNRVVIEEATGPRSSDKRTFASFVPSRKAEQAEIIDRHGNGLHYVGDWHTHPEDVPCPSRTDIESIAECVERSTHDLNGFVLVVVGRLDPAQGLHVSVHDGANYITLTAQVPHPHP